MNADTLAVAIDRANRFLSEAKTLLVAHRKAEASKEPYSYSPITGSPLAGTVKRASMDLTRALATLRRPG